MNTTNQIDNNGSNCMNASGIGTRLMYLALGGGIGAAIALLFAPKPGKELRQDISDAVVRGYYETLDAANHAKEQAVEYYEAAKEKGAEVLDVVAEKASAFKHELSEDATKISGMVEGAAKRAADSVRSRQIF